MKIMALMPAYNESATIGDVISKLQGEIDELVVVDDGSSDNTPEIAKNNGATVLRHSINRGVGAAVRTGYRFGTENNFDYIVQIDADGQHDPSYIPQLLEETKKGYDIVIGSRFLNSSYRQYNFVRRSGIRFFTALSNFLSPMDITDITSGFRVYRVSSLKKLSPVQDEHWAVEQTLEAAKKGFKIKEISVEMPTRDRGSSQFDFDTFFWYPIRMLDILFRIMIFRRQ